MKELFEIGEWVGTEDGIGQVIFNRMIYAEGFELEKDRYKKGEVIGHVYICKVFCSFELQVKKRILIRAYTSIDKLSKNELKSLDKVKQVNYDSYMNYIHFDQKENIKRQVILTYPASANDRVEIKDKIKSINTRLQPCFSYKEFVKEFSKEKFSFSINDFYHKGEMYDRDNVISIRFDSNFYKVKGKEAIFDNVVAVDF
ncbi:hypothetical protein V6R21_01870 [Limibacter armeniacum]|uniref:hypothetical protein n=1 Tax=Limibacter armeniacum TaxID=466084 RepID=UPI002FE570C4